MGPPRGRSTRTSTATAMRTKTAAIGFQRPVSVLHCSDAPTTQAVPVSASGIAVTDNTATASLGMSPPRREHQPHLTLATEKRGVSPPAPGADMPGPPDPRGAIAIRVICLGFATCLHVLVHAQCNCPHLPSIVF